MALASMAACLAALLDFPPGSLMRIILANMPLAAGATMLCLLLAIPASLMRPGLGWLALAALAFCVGAAGWSVVALPADALAAMAATAVLLLPAMVIGLGAAWSRLPAGSWHTAASLGARWPAILRAVLPVVWPAAMRICLVIFTLAAGLLISLT